MTASDAGSAELRHSCGETALARAIYLQAGQADLFDAVAERRCARCGVVFLVAGAKHAGRPLIFCGAACRVATAKDQRRESNRRRRPRVSAYFRSMTMENTMTQATTAAGPTISEAQARLAETAAKMRQLFGPAEIAGAFMATAINVIRDEYGSLAALQMLAVAEREVRGDDTPYGLA